MIQNFKLIEKKNLTHNVSLMIFEWENELEMKPWQFITFLLEKIWGRAYSILKLEWKKIVLIIKKRELDEWGRWWSKLICELNIWESLRWVWPAWHFLLQENNKNKLFIGTWTGFVPLYNMIVFALKKEKDFKIQFIFWIREQSDVFYLEELEKLKSENSNFDYEIYISRVKDLQGYELEHPNNKINSWYTTNFLTRKNVEDFKEAYICWAPTMIEWAVEKLKKLDFDENSIFFEKY
jgi:NAD(P)H-flavin reductase